MTDSLDIDFADDPPKASVPNGAKTPAGVFASKNPPPRHLSPPARTSGPPNSATAKRIDSEPKSTPPPVNGTATLAFSGRTPPHSQEAEEHLLSCCMLDSGETIERCLQEKLVPQAFYHPANQIIYSALCQAGQAGKPMELATLVEELRTTKQLEAVGGMPYLMQISARIPTTAQAAYFIDKVRELYVLRELIKVSCSAVEQSFGYQGGLQEFLAEISGSMEHVVNIATGTQPFDKISKPLADYPFPDDDPIMLLGAPGCRYLGRGGKLGIVAPSGVGKSVTTYQSAACWAIGRPFLGLACRNPLRCLVIQAEDDDGDIGEVGESLKQALQMTPAERKLYSQNVRIIRDDTHTGDAFIHALRAYVRAFKPDLVYINPMVNYCPGMLDEQILSRFLSGLNDINKAHEFAWVVVHHTGKPPIKDDGRQAASSPYERQYSAFGSSVFTNWCRAIINIQATTGDSTGRYFRFNFDKRGRRAGITEENEEGHIVTVTRLRVKHSDRKLTVKGKEYPMILWEIDKDGDQREREYIEKCRKNGAKGGRPPIYSQTKIAMLIEKVAPSADQTALYETLRHTIEVAYPDISESSVRRSVDDLVRTGQIKLLPDGHYYATPGPISLADTKGPADAESSPFDED
jgi:hypothetical protein